VIRWRRGVGATKDAVRLKREATKPAEDPVLSISTSQQRIMARPQAVQHALRVRIAT
jgi:hypothetical protein